MTREPGRKISELPPKNDELIATPSVPMMVPELISVEPVPGVPVPLASNTPVPPMIVPVLYNAGDRARLHQDADAKRARREMVPELLMVAKRAALTTTALPKSLAAIKPIVDRQLVFEAMAMRRRPL